MPAAFVSHGSPMLALDKVRGAEFSRWTATLPTPVAVLCVSAHYQRRPASIGATRPVPLVYDFRGFPKALQQVRYAAPGAPKLAKRVHQQLAPIMKVRHEAKRGHDHGTWVPMKWMYPKADVPLLSLSLPSHDPKTLYRMGRALRPLRDEGVLIVGSGSMTHNLRRLGRPGTATPAWAQEFDAWSTRVLSSNDVDALLDWQRKAPAARTNHPTVEHFVPLLLAAGARKDGEPATFPISGFQSGSMSRRCVTFAPAPKPKAG
ncbi:MAG: class III extradiol ring-cleavage dioxygenase [Planctomycetota bacterium]|nr:class III extradiol ring-cleavage dioxygenase [Planctomycetota bacterium]